MQEERRAACAEKPSDLMRSLGHLTSGSKQSLLHHLGPPPAPRSTTCSPQRTPHASSSSASPSSEHLEKEPEEPAQSSCPVHPYSRWFRPHSQWWWGSTSSPSSGSFEASAGMMEMVMGRPSVCLGLRVQVVRM